MKGAIASVEIFAHWKDGSVQRLTLAIGEPTRAGNGTGWACRVALADRHSPQEVSGPDSVETLARAVTLARDWIEGLHREGSRLFRDRAGAHPYSLD